MRPISLLRSSFLMFCAVAVSLASQSPVLAAGFEEPLPLTNREAAHQNIAFTGGGEGKSTCSEDGGATLVGNDNLEKIYNYFRVKGLSAPQAAGVVGNIAVESGGDPEKIQNPGGRTQDPSTISSGWGIIQWTPGSKILGLLATAKIKSPPHELKTQLDLVWWHMNHTSPTGVQNMYAQFQKITDVSQATIEFEDKVEGAGTPHIEQRIERAKEALRTYDASGGVPSESDNGPECATAEGGGVASIDGFTFPLITTQSALKNHKPYPWCYAKLSNCHHDYKAADLMIPTGTTVIAAKSGRVVSVNSGNRHPNNITIETSDGKGINYYTHLGANTVKLRTGQKVQAGDVLGKVGTSEDAMGTDPHLHFDMLPPRYKYRPSCAGASCSNLPFIEVQPALVETFKKLPES